ncbi:MAG TPA: hypothetical protein PKD05_14260, partial [Candidatus Melainabacteria bacterium]|nr:hypothetical protein [Candidatus Melainabacteria bacterium]
MIIRFRTLALAFASLFLVVSLAACGGGADKAGTEGGGTETAAPAEGGADAGAEAGAGAGADAG